MSPPTVIIGAGLAGLACATELGPGTLVLEREERVGGTARSFVRQGFFFDMTGHWLHLAQPETERLVRRLLGSELVLVERRAEIVSHGTRTPYPFQAHTYGLPPDVIADCLIGYFDAREHAARGREGEGASFDAFIRGRLGEGIARHFMVPYNTKLWTVPPSELCASWCERFVPTPTPEEVVRGALSADGAGRALGYNASFLYPRTGGIQRLADALALEARAEIQLASPVVRVDWRRRRVQLEEGRSVDYRALVSTMPLDDLVAALVDAPEAVVVAAQALRAASVTYWDIGFARPNGPRDAHWTYFPEPDVPFYRVGAPSAAVTSAAPAGMRSFYVEVSHPRGTAAPASDAAILTALAQVRLTQADEEPVIFARSVIDCAYVIPDHASVPARLTILDWLASERIFSVGRYGAWTYDSMEGAMLQGLRAAARVRSVG